MVTWGVNLDQSAPISGEIPYSDSDDPALNKSLADAREFMGFFEGQPICHLYFLSRRLKN